MSRSGPSSKQGSMLCQANYLLKNAIKCKSLLSAVELGEPVLLLEEMSGELISVARRCLRNGADLNKQKEKHIRSAECKSDEDDLKNKAAANVTVAVFCLYRICHLSSWYEESGQSDEFISIGENSKISSAVKLCYHASLQASIIGKHDKEMCFLGIAMNEAVANLMRQTTTWFSKVCTTAPGTSMPIPPCRKDKETGRRLFRLDEKAIHSAIDMVGTENKKEEIYSFIKVIISLNSVTLQSQIYYAILSLLETSGGATGSSFCAKLPESSVRNLKLNFKIDEENYCAGAFRFTSSVVCPWIGLYLSLNGKSKDGIDTCCSFALKIHRILWSATQVFEQVLASNNSRLPMTHPQLLQEILFLRIHAICAVLLVEAPVTYRCGDKKFCFSSKISPSSFLLSSSIMSILFKRNLENACSFAWKGVATYSKLFQKQTRETDLVKAYYKALFDILFLCIQSSLVVVKSTQNNFTSFSEFCVWYFMFITDDLSETENIKSTKMITLANVLCSKFGDTLGSTILSLLNFIRKSYFTKRDSPESFNLCTNQVREMFHLIKPVLLENKDIVGRCYRLLSSMRLTLFVSSISTSDYSSQNEIQLHAISSIICHFFVPVCEIFVWGEIKSEVASDFVTNTCHKIRNEPKLVIASEQIIDALVKIIIAYENLERTAPKCRQKDISDMLEVNYIRIYSLLRLSSSTRILEYASKALGAVGMNSIKENNTSKAILPLLVSVHATTISPKLNRTQSLQRTSTLTSTLYHHNRKLDSLKVLSKLVRIDISSNHSQLCESFDELAWASIISRKGNAWVHSCTLVDQIINFLFRHDEPSQNGKISLNISDACNHILKNFVNEINMDDRVETGKDLIQLFIEILGDEISKHAFLGVLMTVLCSLSKLILAEEQIDRLMSVQDEVLNYLYDQCLEDQSAVIKLSALTLTSRSLGDIRSRCIKKGIDYERIQYKALSMAKEALNILQQKLNSSYSKTHKMIAVLAVQTLILELNGDIDKTDWVEHLLNSTMKIIHAEKELSVYMCYIEKLLLRIFSLFRYRGLTLPSIRILVYCSQLSSDPGIRTWAHMMISNVISESSLPGELWVDLASISHSESLSLEASTYKKLDEIEKSSAQIISKVKTNESYLYQAISEFDQILGLIKNISEEMDYSKHENSPLSKRNEAQWARTTCLLRLADLHRNIGNVDASLRFIRTSIEICRQLLISSNFIDQVYCPSHYSFRWALRIIQCFQLLSHHSLKSGNRRRAEAYARAASEVVENKIPDSTWVLDIDSNSKCLLENRRMRWELETFAAKEVSFPTVLQCSTMKNKLSIFDYNAYYADFRIELIQRLLSVGDAKRRSVKERKTCGEYYREAEKVLETLYCTCNDVNDDSSQIIERNNTKLGQLHYAIKLRSVRFLEIISESQTTIDQIKGAYEEVRLSKESDLSDKGYACYRLGRIYLSQAKTSRALQRVWQADNVDIFDRNITKATELFREAMRLTGPPTTPLAKRNLRCLALTLGPNLPIKPDIKFPESAILIHRSMRGVQRRDVVSSTSKTPTQELFKGIDGDETSLKRFISSIEFNLPLDWNIVAITVCPTGDLLYSSIIKTSYGLEVNTSCVFSSSQMPSILFSIVKPLNHILEENQRQLSSSDKKDKTEWWNERQALDHEIEILLDHLESSYLPTIVKNEIFRDESPKADLLSYHDEISQNLALRFEEAVLIQENMSWNDDLDSMKVVDLKNALEEIGVDKKAYRGLRKAELKDLLIAEKSKRRRRRRVQSSTPTSIESHKDADRLEGNPEIDVKENNHCTMLILDESIHRIPWENLPTLKLRTICRIPSLPFAVSSFIERGHEPNIDLKNVSYVLDPESNLQKTRSTLEPIFQSIMERHDCKWPHIVGEIPNPAFFKENLLRENGLLIYCGHGGGQKFFSKAQIEDLRNSSQSENKCNASVILMGCSSGRLTSANVKKEVTGESYQYYEAEGLVCSYLMAGSPCVIGNLWDVTDRDIDRFFLKLITDFMFETDSSHSSLAEYIARSRDACKMRYLVGCAPVCYGIPIKRKKILTEYCKE